MQIAAADSPRPQKFGPALFPFDVRHEAACAVKLEATSEAGELLRLLMILPYFLVRINPFKIRDLQCCSCIVLVSLGVVHMK